MSEGRVGRAQSEDRSDDTPEGKAVGVRVWGWGLGVQSWAGGQGCPILEIMLHIPSAHRLTDSPAALLSLHKPGAQDARRKGNDDRHRGGP